MVNNRFSFIGRIATAKDKDIKDYCKKNGDTLIMNLPLAVRRDKTTTDFFNITVFNNLAQTIGKYCAKNGQIAISGHITVTKGDKVTYYNFVADEINIIDFKTEDKPEPKPNGDANDVNFEF